ncbi:MAG: chemotaxis protein CheA [Nitrosomonas sp.]|nr:chemotaxis protein CheA [Nitrosomonas sp.]
MSADLEQFYEVFFEESSELLAEMEACLLGLDVNSPDMEDMNAIFRAAHSIKGGAGTFGFTDMTEMTHMLETLLDRLRKGELEVRSEMIDAFLKAGDVIKDQLAGHRGDGGADPAVAAEVCKELSRFSEETKETAGVAAPVPASENVDSSMNEPESEPVDADSDEGHQKTIYCIEFPNEGISAKGQENLLANLNELGKVEKIAFGDDVPLSKLRLTTESIEDDVWEALAFVVDPSHLKIEVQTDADAQLHVEDDSDEVNAELEEPYGFFPEAPGNTTKPYGFFPGAPAAPADANADVDAKKPDAPKKSANSKAVANSAETSSIRVSTEKVDQLINLVGELVITQAMLAQTASEVDPVIFEKLVSGMNQLERNTRDLQESVMSIRMLPISFVFSRFPRVVRDLASKLNKKIELKQVGEGTELDKGLIEKIADPLTHLIRNSLDHGVEMPDVRVAAGKPAQGTITLRAFHQGGSIVIEVGDDGAGLNREKILAKAKERGIPVHDGMPDSEVWMLIFEAGFSTAAVVTDVSGRGVGMDVVKRNISAMGGRVDIESALGVGTRISVRLPLTLAILDGLSVGVGDQMFIVPLTYIIESLQPTAEDIKTVSGRGRVVKVRGEYLPVVALHEVFNLKPTSEIIHDGILVILEAEGQKAAMLVDTLIGQHQVVIKSLESNYRRVQGVSGATIMGDGKVALILDTAALVTSSHKESV